MRFANGWELIEYVDDDDRDDNLVVELAPELVSAALHVEMERRPWDREARVAA